MTLNEIKNRLRCKYIPVNGNCRQIQEQLFSLGCRWRGGSEKIRHIDCNYIYVDSNGYSFADVEKLNEYDSKENIISLDYLYSLELTEPVYRPFYNIAECLREMYKHQAFGFLMSIYKDRIVAINRMSESYRSELWIGIDDRVYTLHELFSFYTFVDSSPFGLPK